MAHLEQRNFTKLSPNDFVSLLLELLPQINHCVIVS